jgi:hypothetical protein
MPDGKIRDVIFGGGTFNRGAILSVLADSSYL